MGGILYPFPGIFSLSGLFFLDKEHYVVVYGSFGFYPGYDRPVTAYYFGYCGLSFGDSDVEIVDIDDNVVRFKVLFSHFVSDKHGYYQQRYTFL
jgi:hypothetical protein